MRMIALLNRLLRYGVVGGTAAAVHFGVLLLQASDYRSAEVLILQDPMVRSGQVDWQLHQWVEAVGHLNAT